VKQHQLRPGEYYLVVARLEPENNVALIIREYVASSAKRPLVVVGGSQYGTEYAKAILDKSNLRVRCLGPIYDSPLINGLYRECYCYVHGHEVGGTNPSLLRAMQAGCPCVAVDVVFTREVLGEAGLFFDKALGDLASLFSRIDNQPEDLAALGGKLKERASREYRWDAVAAAFDTLIQTLLDNRRRSTRPEGKLEVYRPRDFSEKPPAQAQ
jgi:glycosyltransferase involved in cell wall biosynthesis